MVLINKLQTDTKQRVVLYDALTKSLKTAQQQDVAHRINEIGVKTDQEAQTAMAGHRLCDQCQKMAEMLGGPRGSHGLCPRRAGTKGQGRRTLSPGVSSRSWRSTTAISMGVDV